MEEATRNQVFTQQQALTFIGERIRSQKRTYGRTKTKEVGCGDEEERNRVEDRVATGENWRKTYQTDPGGKKRETSSLVLCNISVALPRLVHLTASIVFMIVYHLEWRLTFPNPAGGGARVLDQRDACTHSCGGLQYAPEVHVPRMDGSARHCSHGRFGKCECV